MSFGQAIKNCNEKYFGFSGRARRSEYWLFSLFGLLMPIGFVLVGLLLGALTQDPAIALGIISVLDGLFALYMIVPSLAVTCRRLHDVGKSGAYILIDLVPVVGPILLLIWMLQDSDPGDNQYGPYPKQIRDYYPAPSQGTASGSRGPVLPDPVSLPAPTNEGENPTVSIQQGQMRILTGLMRGATIPLPDGEQLWLGRDAKQCAVVLDQGYQKVSRAHCCVSYHADGNRAGYYVMDNSSNGTFYSNMQRLQRGVKTYIPAGTEVLLGDRECRVRLE